VRRHRTLPSAIRFDDRLGATVDGSDLVFPAGDVEIRLRPLASAPSSFVARWRWVPRPGSTTAVPDQAESTVRVEVQPPADLTLVHDGVRAPDAVLLGLIWDHLLDRVAELDASPLPWVPMLDEIAARAAAQASAARQRRDQLDALRWGGPPPSDRLRALPANAVGLARLDRGLLDALAAATPPVQRAIAAWGARQACTAARLSTIDWVAPALAAVDRGAPLPPPFDGDTDPWDRLWADRRVPSTTVTIPTGTPNCSQQAIALPAIRAATHDDPLAGAVDTVYFAALAYGGRYRELLTAASAKLAELTGRG
jgi:hypothetical protein